MLFSLSSLVSSNDSSDTDERRSTLSDEGSVSSFDGSDDGRHRYVDSNVFGVKKRIAKTRRLGPGSHHSRHRPSFKKTGKISFETEYNEEKQELQVHLLRAVELAPKLEVEHINPFVRVYLVPGKLQKQSTHFKKSTKEPVFNETVHFIDINKDQLQRHKLRMKVVKACFPLDGYSKWDFESLSFGTLVDISFFLWWIFLQHTAQQSM